jgi:hypothetical protein
MLALGIRCLNGYRSLDPINEQSEHAAELLALFQQRVLDEPYRLRLRRHHRLFHEELRRRGNADPPPTP